tara:strand:+ start:9153 stop:9371 length:219 start_codon:yes stop_codon:yes gene_type:complete
MIRKVILGLAAIFFSGCATSRVNKPQRMLSSDTPKVLIKVIQTLADVPEATWNEQYTSMISMMLISSDGQIV